MESYMTIQIVPKKRKRGVHIICQTHGINKRICRQTPHETKTVTIYPDWLCDDGPVVIDKTVFSL